MHSRITLQFFKVTLRAFVLLISYTSYAGNPTAYIMNLGQWDDHILFKANVGGGYVFAEQNKVTFVMSEADQIHHVEESQFIEIQNNEVFGKFAYQVEFINSNDQNEVVGLNKMSSFHNYYTNSNPSKWKSEVPLYESVVYQKIYDKIDLQLKSKENLYEYDFILYPGAEPSQIKMKYVGIDNVTIVNGQLHLKTPMGNVVELAPIVYQEINHQQVLVKAQFKLSNNNEVGFEIVESYNKNEKLTIDPVLVFSTYTGSFSDNWGFTATYDLDGNLYAGGMAVTNGYPTTIGAYDTIYNGGESNEPTDIVISKFSPDGTQLIYSTYIGGSRNEIPHSLIVTDNNELVVYGTTGSFDYPVSINAFDNTFNGGVPAFAPSSINYLTGSDIVITKLNEYGTNIVGSTFFGGSDNDGLNLTGFGNLDFNYGDFARGDVTIGSEGDIYIASCTFSNDVEVSPNSFQPIKDSGLSGLVARFNNDLSQLKWATYLGGIGDDAAYTIELIGDEIALAGGTTSANLPGMVGLNPTYLGGQSDGFILKLNQNGITSNGGTFIGTSEYDQVYFLEIDEAANIYVFGQTLGNYPVSANVYSVQNATQFIHKINNSLTESIYSTVFGSPHASGETRRVNISPTAFLVDNCTNVYAAGWGGNVNQRGNPNIGSTNNLFTTTDAIQTATDGSDFYFLVLENDASQVQYATYFGELGGVGDHVDGGTSRFDKNGIVYHASCASCGTTQGFPTTPGVWSEDNLGSNCNMAAFKLRFDKASINVVLEADPIVGCPPLEVNFDNISNIVADAYFWDFDDGTTSTLANPVHTFNIVGVYNVQFIIIDSANCLTADTAYIQITVTDDLNGVLAAFNIGDLVCQSTNIQFENTSQNAGNYLWDFGDGNTSTLEDPQYTYTDTGIFIVTLYADPGSSCGDTISLPVHVVNNTLGVSFSFNQADCNDTTGTVQFSSSFSSTYGIQDLIWNFGDGTTSTEVSPVHAFETGIYMVSLFATDSIGCSDFVSNTVSVSNESLTVNFAFITSCNPLSSGVQFNASAQTIGDIVTWEWDLGNGTVFFGPQNLVYFYSQEGTYNVTLTAVNSLACTATYTQSIDVFFNGPNASFEFETMGCSSPTVIFTNTSSPLDSIVSLLWDFGDGQTSTELNPTHTYPQSGNYFAILTVTSSSGCQSTFTKFIGIPNLNVFISIGSPSVCGGVNEFIGFSVSGTTSSFITQTDWDFGDGIQAIGVFSTIHAYSAPGTYIVQYVIANNDGCIDTLTQELIIPSGPEVHIDYTRDACNENGLTVNFDVDSDIINDIVEITWDFGDGTSTMNEFQPVHEYSDTGNYTVIINFLTNLGCSGTDTVYIDIVDITVQSHFTLESSQCAPQIVSFNNESTSNEIIIGYNWDFGDGTTSNVINPIKEYNNLGTYQVFLTVTTFSGCTDIYFLDVLITELVLDANFVTTIECNPLNLEMQFTDASISDSTIVGWNWSFGDNTTSTQQSPTHVYSGEGSFTVQLIIENSSGCFDTLIQIVEVDIPALNAGFTADTLICNNSSVVFTNTTTSEEVIDQWNWDLGNGTFSNEETPVTNYSDTGIYEVTLVVNSISGCTDSAKLLIDVTEAKPVELTDSLFICQGDSIQLPLVGNVGQTYLWQPAQFLENNTIAQPIAFPNTTTFFEVVVDESLANGNICSLNDGVWVIVNEIPSVTAVSDQTEVIAGAIVNLNATSGYVDYIWSPNQNLSDNTINSPTATILEEITYQVQITDENGCKNTDSVTIRVIENIACQLETLFIPNAFSPNGDGQNDELFVRIQGEIDRIDFRIYNRWGELVFETDDISLGWNGRYRDKQQDTDVFGYFLEMECNQELITKQGNITLVR